MIEFDPHCDLCCKREPITTQYYEDNVVWIVDCLKCQVPMAVLKRHATDPKQHERNHCIKITEQLFPEATLDFRMKTIPDHFHFHVLLPKKDNKQ